MSDRRPPPGSLVDRAHPHARGLVAAWAFTGRCGGYALDLLSGRKLTLAGYAAGTDPFADTPAGRCPSFNGTSDYGSVPLNLSGTRTITLGFGLTWTTFANNDALAMEFTANTNTAAGAFYIDPNDSQTGSIACTLGASTTLCTNGFPRPAAGVPHRYDWALDRTATTVAGQIAGYLDGVPQPMTGYASQSTPVSDAFADDTLYLMSRAGSSLFGAGSLAWLTIHSRIRPPAEIADAAGDPWAWIAASARDRRRLAAAGFRPFFCASNLTGGMAS